MAVLNAVPEADGVDKVEESEDGIPGHPLGGVAEGLLEENSQGGCLSTRKGGEGWQTHEQL